MRTVFVLGIAVLAAGCASAGPAPAPSPAPLPGSTPRAALPAIPAADGALDLRVAYPSEGARVTARDSTFIFGQTGSGRATLTINGAPVEVAPNGAFLAFLPVPTDGVYRLQATRDAETAAREFKVEIPARTVTGPTGPTITSVSPSGALTVREGERVPVTVRATPGARVRVVLPDGAHAPLVESGGFVDATDPADNFRAGGAQSRSETTLYRGLVPVRSDWQLADTSVTRPRLAPTIARAAVRDAPLARPEADPQVELVLGADTVRRPLRLNLAVLPEGLSLVGVATPPANAPGDWTVRGRIDVGGPFHYFWAAGTRFHITGERDNYYRVHLAGALHAWVPANDVRLLEPGTPPPASTIAAVRFRATPDYIDLRVPLSERLPYRVEQGEHSLTLDVFGAISQVNFFQYGTLDPAIRRAVWSQPADSVYRVVVDLAQPVWGYDVRFDDAGALILRIRRPPAIDVERPLAGLRIAIDAGHPPAGAIGPTGLTEAEANLGISLHIEQLLQAAGAHVIMTRRDGSPVELGARPRMAADSNAHVLVSVHNNAFPDGVNPFTNNGTSVYYFHPHSIDLARQLQAELLAELGLRDIGVGRADLALVRPTWMPAALTETMYLMVPEQEAALRDPTVQRRIAQAHVRALEQFLRARAAARP